MGGAYIWNKSNGCYLRMRYNDASKRDHYMYRCLLCICASQQKCVSTEQCLCSYMSFCWAVGFRAEWILHHMKFTSRRANCLRYQMNKFTLKMLHNFWYGINANEFVHINEQWKKWAMQKWFLSIRAMVCHSTDNTNHRDDDTWSSISLSHDNHSTKKNSKIISI